MSQLNYALRMPIRLKMWDKTTGKLRKSITENLDKLTRWTLHHVLVQCGSPGLKKKRCEIGEDGHGTGTESFSWQVSLSCEVGSCKQHAMWQSLGFNSWVPLGTNSSCHNVHYTNPLAFIWLGKGKVHPTTAYEGPEQEQMYSSTLPSTSALDGGGWSTPGPGRFTPGKDPVPIV